MVKIIVTKNVSLKLSTGSFLDVKVSNFPIDIEEWKADKLVKKGVAFYVDTDEKIIDFTKASKISRINCCSRVIKSDLNEYTEESDLKLTIGYKIVDDVEIFLQTPGSVYLAKPQKHKCKLAIGTLLDKVNEWFFPTWIKYVKQFSDNIIVLVDTFKGDVGQKVYDLCRENNVIIKPIGFHWYETRCWAKLLYECLDFQPEWVWFATSDEVYEDKLKEELPKMLNDLNNFWYGFKVYHFWNDNYCRIDGTWGIGRTSNCIKIIKNVLNTYDFGNRVWHGSSFPNNIQQFPGKAMKLRIKHYGHSKKGKWKEKCDIRGKAYSVYESKYENNIEVLKWVENETWEEGIKRDAQRILFKKLNEGQDEVID